MVIDALALEKDIEFSLAGAQIEAAFACHFSQIGARTVLQNCVQTIDKLKRLAEFDVLTNQAPGVRGSVDAIVKLYEALEKANIILPDQPETPET